MTDVDEDDTQIGIQNKKIGPQIDIQNNQQKLYYFKNCQNIQCSIVQNFKTI